MNINEIEKYSWDDLKKIKLEDIIDLIKENNKENHLLMANGVSMDFNNNLFSYDNIKDSLDDAIKPWIHRDSNFENSIKGLNAYKNALASKDYLNEKKLIDFPCDKLSEEEVDDIIEKIRENLVKIITQSHPERSSDVSYDEYKSFYYFLNHFSTIFTLNYDLLVYWLIAKFETKFNDGFSTKNQGRGRHSTLAWSPKNMQNYFSLHGSLVTFMTHDRKTTKITYSRNELPIKSVIEELIVSNNTFPICVTEGDHEAKLNRINQYEYLKHSHEKIGDRTGTMVVIGSSFNDNEIHIYEQIFKNNNISHFYIGLFEEQAFKNFKKIIKSIGLNDKINFTLFYSKTDFIWRNNAIPLDFELKERETRQEPQDDNSPKVASITDSESTKNIVGSNSKKDTTCMVTDCEKRQTKCN